MRSAPAFMVLALWACGGSPPTSGPAHPASDPQASKTTSPALAAVPELPLGGMWLPEQLPSLSPALAGAGLAIPATQLAKLEDGLLGAIVSIPGCSASLVSSDGLILTNHHCVQDILAYHAAETGEPFQDRGFLARTRSEERWNGPTGRVLIPAERTEVSARVDEALAGIDDPIARQERYEALEKELLAECEARASGHRCSFHSFFGGGTHVVQRSLEIRDVRLVYAPPDGVGNFGGDVDNWMWPRHSGDFAFLRAYVGPDGKPADHAENNIPFQSPHHLRVATEALEPGQLVMVAGYPGSTDRNLTLAEIEDAATWKYPRKVERYDQVIERLQTLEARGGKTGVIARRALFGFHNGKKRDGGVLEQLRKGSLLAGKRAQWKTLHGWIAAGGPDRAHYQRAIEGIEAALEAYRPHRELRASLGELGDVDLNVVASQIVHMAHERGKPDAERDPAYQERNWDRLRGRLASMDQTYDRAVDLSMFALAVERARRHPEANQRWLQHIPVRGSLEGRARYEAALRPLFESSRLESAKVRQSLFDEATLPSLKKSRDPFIRLALALYPIEKELEAAARARDGALLVHRPRYVEALAHAIGPISPDADRSLRLGFGRIRGFRPEPSAEPYHPFTTLSGLLAKHQGVQPFLAPQAVVEAASMKSGARWVDARLGEVPVDFLSEVTLTGGSSGSATLDAHGRLIGVAFDTNLEAIGSDWLVDPEISRAIHVHISYVLWMLDAVEHADHLLRELGVSPTE